MHDVKFIVDLGRGVHMPQQFYSRLIVRLGTVTHLLHQMPAVGMKYALPL